MDFLNGSIHRQGREANKLSDDPVIRNYREQISELDLKLLETLNERINLVKHFKVYKEAQGLGFYDAAQEDRVIAGLSEANPGPLSREGLKEIFRLILEWTKRTTAEPGEVKPDGKP